MQAPSYLADTLLEQYICCCHFFQDLGCAMSTMFNHALLQIAANYATGQVGT